MLTECVTASDSFKITTISTKVHEIKPIYKQTSRSMSHEGKNPIWVSSSMLPEHRVFNSGISRSKWSVFSFLLAVSPPLPQSDL